MLIEHPIDFAAAARRFRARDWQVAQFAQDIWQFVKPGDRARPRVVLSVGVHGDETAPVELLADLLHEWAVSPDSIACDFMLFVGNPAAVAAQRRFVEVDMNRLFAADIALAQCADGRRAAQVMAVVRPFCTTRDGAPPCLHLDLHTAIRPSLFKKFAVLPTILSAARRGWLVRWLEQAGLDCALLNPFPAATLSAFTASAGAVACTVELGRIGRFGENDHTLLRGFRQAVHTLFSGAYQPSREPPRLPMFRAQAELIKHSPSFKFLVDCAVPNFTEFAAGEVIASDTNTVYTAGESGARLVFPNPAVRVGQRAGLVVTQTTLQEQGAMEDNF